MAASTVTIDTNEWLYPDMMGVTHAVNNGQTFSMTVTDGGASAVEYSIPVAQKVTTTDGYTLYFRPETDINNNQRTIGYLTDSGQGSDFYSLRGELCIECPVTGIVQRWRVAKMNPSDADFGSAGTIGFTLEDQFANKFSCTGVTVGQAA